MKKTKIQNVQKPRDRVHSRSCNLCLEEFAPHTVFDRYCATCKEENELLKFSEWLPEIDRAITERLSA